MPDKGRYPGAVHRNCISVLRKWRTLAVNKSRTVQRLFLVQLPGGSNAPLWPPFLSIVSLLRIRRPASVVLESRDRRDRTLSARLAARIICQLDKTDGVYL
ncbi:hypothetical protein SAMN04515648_2545 [Phyllobacterium sp. CL33Tsu]|nr:hypothetical protein SAMN04515648_2545 [Phyllobacterium sp. CL33Tsu]